MTLQSEKIPAGSESESPNGQPEMTPDFDLIFGAPDFTTLIKRPKTAKSREYSTKIASALKAAAIGSMQAGNFSDASAILWHGPGFADAAGDLASSDERAAKAIDLLTSPNSPWLVFVLTGIPLIAQILRNHETQIEDLPGKFNMSRRARAQRKTQKESERRAREEIPTFTLRAFGRKIPIFIRKPSSTKFLSAFFRGVQSQTHDPNELTNVVFSDPKLIAALDKLGIKLRQASNDQ